MYILQIKIVKNETGFFKNSGKFKITTYQFLPPIMVSDMVKNQN